MPRIGTLASHGGLNSHVAEIYARAMRAWYSADGAMITCTGAGHHLLTFQPGCHLKFSRTNPGGIARRATSGGTASLDSLCAGEAFDDCQAAEIGSANVGQVLPDGETIEWQR